MTGVHSNNYCLGRHLLWSANLYTVVDTVEWLYLLRSSSTLSNLLCGICALMSVRLLVWIYSLELSSSFTANILYDNS